MTHAATVRPTPRHILPNRVLASSAKLWFVAAAFGHLLFLIYIVGYWGLLLVGGGAEALADTHLPNGFVAGDPIGNAAVVAHLMLGIIVIGGVPLQLIPAIRQRFPTFHRWLGRTYAIAAVTTATAGLFMIWSRGTIGGPIAEIAISLDGVLIIVFALMAVRYAMGRNFVLHRRWALRLFIVASAVWFYRVGLMGWVFVTGGLGVDFKTFSGPFITFWGFAQYLLPLALLELYFHAQKTTNRLLKIGTAVTLFGFTVAMSIGIFAATMSLWLPRL